MIHHYYARIKYISLVEKTSKQYLQKKGTFSILDHKLFIHLHTVDGTRFRKRYNVCVWVPFDNTPTLIYFTLFIRKRKIIKTKTKMKQKSYRQNDDIHAQKEMISLLW